VKAPPRRPALERLEDRTVPSVDTIQVRTLVGATDTLATRSLSLPTNDLVYDPLDGMVYASVPSSAGTTGNRLAEIDPTTGSVVSSFSVGSEPNKLAVSDDGQFVYVGLMGAPNVVRFNVPDQEVDLTFSLGSDSFFGPRFAEDLQVVSGDPHTVAVSREYHGVSPRHAGVALYTDGVKLQAETPGFQGSNSIAFGATADRLYGYNNETTEFGFRRMNVDLSSGVTTQDSVGGVISGFGVTIKYDPGTGLVYATNGTVVNPEPDSGLPQLAGTYSGVGFASSVLPDSATARTFFVSGSQLFVYDQSRFTLAERFTLPSGGHSLIRWGDNKLAYSSGSQVYFLALTPDPASLATNDLVYDPLDGMVYASVPGTAGPAGNSLAEINPSTGRVVTTFFVGSEPNKLAVSDDGEFIYVGLDGAGSVARFDVSLHAVDLTFSLGTGAFGPMFAEDIQVAPGDPSTVAVSREYHGVSPRHAGVALYTDGVKLQDETPGHTGSNSIAFGATAGRLYGYNNETTEFGFRRMNVDSSSGVTVQDATGGLVGAFNVTIRFDPGTGLIYTTNGHVINPEPDSGPPQLVGTYSGVGFASSVLPDSATGRIFFLDGNVLRVYDETTFTPIETFTLPSGGGSLIRWGDNQLAYRSGSQVYFVTLTPT
jgi:sugar lactone lactonase YvrE